MTNSNANMIAIENKILKFQKENEEVQQAIQLGSDQHLDLILEIKELVEPLTERYDLLITDLIPEVNRMNTKDVNILLPALIDLYATSIKLVTLLKRNRLTDDTNSSKAKYYSQVENLRELIFDLENFRSGEHDELDGLLGEINSL